jgi:hypothetical protein
MFIFRRPTWSQQATKRVFSWRARDETCPCGACPWEDPAAVSYQHCAQFYGPYQKKSTRLIWGDRELQREQVWSRIHLVPLLVAEGDRDAYRRQQAALEREREIMKDVKGWEVSN